MNSLGGLAFSDAVRLLGVGSQPRRAFQVKQTLGGGLSVTSIPLSLGRELTLEAFRDGESLKGTFTGAQFAAFAAMRDAGEKVTLVHHLGTFRVLILTVDLDTINGVADPDGSSLYIGTITCREA